ncbi:hypothetical protein, partial [Chromobacterium amazonense]|uniref:hypothetical protein n=1 Tax=Chromobacterium amazonense TaxID=1382803 RepID=UPI0031F66C7C
MKSQKSTFIVAKFYLLGKHLKIKGKQVIGYSNKEAPLKDAPPMYMLVEDQPRVDYNVLTHLRKLSA